MLTCKQSSRHGNHSGHGVHGVSTHAGCVNITDTDTDTESMTHTTGYKRLVSGANQGLQNKHFNGRQI